MDTYTEYISSILIFILVFTASEDGTSNKHVNYDAHHINLKVSDDLDEVPTHHHQFLGIVSSPDQSAEGQAEDLVEQIDDVLKIYNKSPLAKWSGHFMHFVKAISLVKGVNTDHCSKEKKFSNIMKSKVVDAVCELLGETEVLEKSWEEIDILFDKARDDMIDKAGGQDAWETLPEAEQALQHAIMLEQTSISLGEDKYAEMSEEEQRELDFFVWTCCGCHKNLNSVSGGNTPMMAWWAENDVMSP